MDVYRPKQKCVKEHSDTALAVREADADAHVNAMHLVPSPNKAE